MKYPKRCNWFEACPLKRFYEQGKLDKRWIEDYCWKDYLQCTRREMEEKGLFHPDNMLPDGTIDRNLK